MLTYLLSSRASPFLQLLVPNDYRGLASLLITRDEASLHKSDPNACGSRVLAALRLLRQTNPIVRRTLTCFERELGGEAFPQDGGGTGAMPSMPQDGAGFQERRDEGVGANAAAPAPVRAVHVSGLTGVAGASLSPPRFLGAAVSVLEIDAAATEDRNSLQQQTIGNRVERGTGRVVAQPVRSSTATTSPDNAVHTVLYPRGEGGYMDKDDKSNCTREHHRKKTLLSVAEPNRAAEEVTEFPPGSLSPPISPLRPVTDSLHACRVSTRCSGSSIKCKSSARCMARLPA